MPPEVGSAVTPAQPPRPYPPRRIRLRPPSPILRRQVETDVLDLIAEGRTEEYSRILARRYHCHQAIIDETLARLMATYRSGFHTLRGGQACALSQAQEAMEAVWRE